MRLEVWMKENRVTQAEFAARVGTTQETVSKWIAGLRMPRPKRLALIKSETGGAVTADDFLGSVEDEEAGHHGPASPSRAA